MNKRRFHKAIDKVFRELSELSREEFLAKMKEHENGEFAQIIRETKMLEMRGNVLHCRNDE